MKRSTARIWSGVSQKPKQILFPTFCTNRKEIKQSPPNL